MASNSLKRSDSISAASEGSQTAQDFIQAQLQLEADAREALPYQFDTCTRPLGALRQILFSCLTCNPPLADSAIPYTPAGICYSCSISCHGEHQLVELFAKRNFVCDCGTTRLPTNAPCTLRISEATGLKGGVIGEGAREGNTYNQNYQNKFCGCSEEYDPHQEKGTMFQCLGLSSIKEKGCGEDWWHPECIVGLERKWYEKSAARNGVASSQDMNSIKEEPSTSLAKRDSKDDTHNDTDKPATNLESVSAVIDGAVNTVAAALPIALTSSSEPVASDKPQHDDPPNPPGFPDEDDFEYLLCYKCVDAFPWIKRYAGQPGFLPAVHHSASTAAKIVNNPVRLLRNELDVNASQPQVLQANIPSRKRKAEEQIEEATAPSSPKRQRSAEDLEEESILAPSENATGTATAPETTSTCRYDTLPRAPEGSISLFLKPDFRDYLCRCSSCFPLLAPHPQLLEEEESYSPPVSEDGDDDPNNPGTNGNRSVGTGSLLDRGEAALSTMDRVRAIEGITAYNHVRDKVKAFLKPYAESGQMVSAEDVKAYFAGLRGDVSGGAQKDDGGDSGVDGDGRREQSGY